MENRADYAKVFNYQQPGAFNHINASGGVVGIDPNDIINMFNFKKNRRMLAFQNRLVQEEEDKYINYRFNRKIIKKLTLLDGPALDSFMVRYRPSYYFVQASNDLELYQYIWASGKQYVAARKPDN